MSFRAIARASRLVFTHHDPDSDDDTIDALLGMARARAAEAEFTPQIDAAAEDPVFVDAAVDRLLAMVESNELAVVLAEPYVPFRSACPWNFVVDTIRSTSDES